MRNNSAGFSLLELLVVITIILLLAMTAMPSMTALIEKWSAERQIREILHVVQKSKAKAAQLGQVVVICGVGRRDSGNQCQKDWSHRVIAFVDGDKNNRFTEKDRVIYELHPLAEGSGMKLNSNRLRYIVRSNGTLKSTPGSLYFCTTRNPENNKRLVIDRLGRVRQAQFERGDRSGAHC